MKWLLFIFIPHCFLDFFDHPLLCLPWDVVNVLNYPCQNDERVSYHRCWLQTNLWLQHRKFQLKISECLQKQNRGCKGTTLTFTGRTAPVMLCGPGLGHLMWGMVAILVSTRTLIVPLLYCVWCYSTNLFRLIRFWRTQKGPTPDQNCFPWWHYWVLF